MSAQGWQPGEYLGAKNANHAAHYTAANASHIRVTVREENLGLGAKIGSGVGAGECTGLDAFKDILGRLNGKDEADIAKEQKSREDLKRAIYTERKWGSLRFVPGGFLIGDKIENLIADEAERIRKLKVTDSSSGSDTSESEEEESPEPLKALKKSKKRKLDEDVDAEIVSRISKKSKKQKLENEGKAPELVAVKVKKSKKRRKSKSTVEQDQGVGITTEDTEDISEREKRKEEKRKKKARREKESSKADAVATKESKKKSKKDRRAALDDILESSSTNVTKENTPSIPSVPASGNSTPMMQGRHAVRSRNIAQKRLASMDIASLNQVCHFRYFLRLSLMKLDFHDQGAFIDHIVK